MNKFPYKKGDLVTIYEDWQTETGPTSRVLLMRKLKSGSTFILKEMLPESSQLVYSYEEWEVQHATHATFQRIPEYENVKIRYLHNIGLTPSTIKEDEPENDYQLPIQDSFIVIHGTEVF